MDGWMNGDGVWLGRRSSISLVLAWWSREKTYIQFNARNGLYVRKWFSFFVSLSISCHWVSGTGGSDLRRSWWREKRSYIRPFEHAPCTASHTTLYWLDSIFHDVWRRGRDNGDQKEKKEENFQVPPRRLRRRQCTTIYTHCDSISVSAHFLFAADVRPTAISIILIHSFIPIRSHTHRHAILCVAIL